jgi:hypothetical protein
MVAMAIKWQFWKIFRITKDMKKGAKMRFGAYLPPVRFN